MIVEAGSRAASGGSADPQGQAVVANVLIVDDHPANLLALEGILEPLGQRIVRASSGEEALRRLLHEDFAVILMDVQMPGLDGLQTARLIKDRERSRHIPIIFLTAINKDSSHVFRGYSSGAVDYLLKPFDPDILRSKVAVFIELYAKSERIKRQEARLREVELDALERASQERYQHLTDAMPLLLFVWDASRTVVHCNRAWHDYTGRTFDETARDGFAGSLHPDDVATYRTATDDAVARSAPFEAHVRVRRHDGAYRWFLVRALPERDVQGAIVRWIGTGTDVDDQKRDREVLAEFKATLDAARDGVLIIDPVTLVPRYANEGVVEQFGLNAERLAETPLWAFDVEPDEARYRAFAEALRGAAGDARTMSATWRRADGGAVPVDVVLQLIDTPNLSARLVAIVRDITDRVRTETELRKANEAKDEFLAAASHELRTPLAAVKAQAQLAIRRMRELADDHPHKRALATINGQIDRMTKLVDNLLDVSRIQVGRLSLELEEIDLAHVVRDVVERVRPIAERCDLVVDAPERLLVRVDRDRLDQVVSNLVGNAIRYSPNGGEIRVELARVDEHRVRLVVRDHGVGIPVDKQAIVFERFGRAHGSKFGGLGLGLTIALGIVEQHGGRIWVESTGVPGEGSAFHVELPVS